MDLINKLIPTKIQTVIKVFLISIFPFNFDRWAPKYPPVKEPIINNINIFEGTDPILAKKTAPTKFQNNFVIFKFMSKNPILRFQMFLGIFTC